MNRYLAFSLAMLAASSMAQIPTNLTFKELTTQYLPFIGINTAYILNDTRASQQLAMAEVNPVTIFMTLDLPFEQFQAKPPPSPAAGQIETGSVANTRLTSDLFQYMQLDGIHHSTSFNGKSFMETRFNDTRYEQVTGGQKIEVFRNKTDFYIGVGIGFKSNVVIPDIEFAGGIIHIVDNVLAPPYSLGDTGTVLDIAIIERFLQASPYLQNTSDITVFAPQNNVFPPPLNGTSNYIVTGSVLYSTELISGKSVLATSKNKLNVTTDASGEIFIDKSRIVQSDIIIANGVVHVIEYA